MKKIISIILFVLAFVMNARAESKETVLFEGTQEITNWGAYLPIDANTVAEIKAGDQLIATVSTKDEDVKWPQLNFQSKVGEDFTGTNQNGETKNQYNILVLNNAGISNVTEFPTTVNFTFADCDIEALKVQNSLYLSGTGVTVTKLVLVQNNPKIEVVTTLSDKTVVTGDWANDGWIKLGKDLFSGAKAGDKVVVNVTELDTEGSSHKVLFQKGDWKNNFGSVNISSTSTLPFKATLMLTDEILSTIRGEEDGIAEGLIVKGCYFTFNQVDLIRYYEVDPSVEKGNAVTNVWTGDATISWATGSSHSESIDKSKFTDLKAGDKIRATFASMKLGAQGKILHNWTSWDTSIVPTKKLPTECGDYFEYTVTEQMVTDIKNDGLRVSGIGYNLTSVDIIDPAKEYTVVADFDRNDIKAWEPEETPNLTFTLQSIEANEITVPIVVTLSKDTYEDFRTYTEKVTLASGEKKTVDVNLTNLEPGFYRMTAKANNNTVCTYYIGYNPTAIGCENDAQPDFWTFWDKEKRKLAKIGIDATLTELTDKSTTNRKVYEVKMQSVPDAEGENNVYIYGYYAEPTGEGTYPCLVRFQGTDSGSGNPTAMGGDNNPGWCELIISTRGQMLSRVKDNDEFKKFLPSGQENADFYAYGLGDNDKHYYRAAYLDCKRAIDFVASRTAVNKDQIFAAGGSQGGCFTYVAAALDDRIRAIAPSITGHADFPHTMEIVSWPTSIFNTWITAHSGAGEGNYATAEEAKAALLKHLSYFDTKNFASRITCPVITNFSLQDQTDGPHLNISPYNLLKNVAAEDKAYSINPFKGHAAADNWETTFKEFFNKYMSTPATKSYFLSVGETGYSTVYLPFDALVPNGVKVYTVNSIGTDKVQLTGHTAENGNQLLLPKTTAVVVNATEGDYQFVANSTDIPTTSVSGTNLLNGVTERTAVSSLNSGDYTIYALGSGNDNIAGFYKVNSDSYIPANKAYLSVETSSPLSSSKAFYIPAPTGITNVDKEGQNGDAPVYSIDGVRKENVNKPGVYVRNGKKTLYK